MKNRYSRCPLAAATAMFLAALSAPAVAENTWTGTTNGDWFEPTNWSEGVVPPNGSTDVRINNSANAPILAGDTVDMSDNNLAVGYESGSNADTANLTITAGASLTNFSGSIGYEAGASGQVNVFGAGTQWKNEHTLAVGWYGEGTLEVSQGGAVDSQFAIVGGFAGSNGIVSVREAGSVFNSGLIGVGVEGEGLMSVEQGGAVNSTDAVIGSSAGPGGTVVVTGVGSNWINTDRFIVGDSGAGKLIVQAGGLVFTGSASIAENAGAQGDVLVTGNGSSWVSSGAIDIGRGGSGKLTVSNGGRVRAQAMNVGALVGSTGLVLLMDDQLLESVGDIVIGDAGTGELAVRGGAVHSEGKGWIGKQAGGQGLLGVVGPGTKWTSDELTVGESGTGELLIADMGHVENIHASIGGQAGGHGSAFVSGDSIWQITQGLIVGNAGTGTLGIENGGLVEAGLVAIGQLAQSQGTVSMAGTGAFLSTAQLVVGDEGTGTLSIADGARIDVDSAAIVGDAAGSQGSIVVGGTGSRLVAGGMFVGHEGTGTLSIYSGGLVEIDDGEMIVGFRGNGTVYIADGGKIESLTDTRIGSEAGSKGSVFVDGAGSTWTIRDTGLGSYIGYFGAGNLMISGGGSVISERGSSIGEGQGSQGTVTVSGAGSQWTNGNYLTVGDDGAGTLTITDGGNVSSGNAWVGLYDGSRGDVVVAGAGSTWTNSADLFIGFEGAGTLTIQQGGSVNNSDAAIGGDEGQGDVTVAGAGSTWTTRSKLSIGVTGVGTVTLADGGTAKVSDPVIVADFVGSIGTLNIGAAAGQAAVAAGKLEAAELILGDGNGSLNFNHTGNRDGSDVVFATAIGGNGSVNQLGSGTTVLTAQNTYAGTTTVSAGTLAVDGSITASTLQVQAGGRLSGTGIVGNTTLAGTLAPGHSIGELTVQGDLHQLSGSNYEVELGANGTSDHVHVTGQATLDTQANLRLLSDVSYVPGTRYTVLTADGGINGQYALVNQGALTAFLSAKPVYDATHAYLDLAQSRSFASVGQTRNQIATAAAVERIGGGHKLFDTVLLLPNETQARDAFDQLSGEAHASVRGALLEESRDLRDAIGERSKPGGGSFWVQGLGAWGHLRGDGNAARLESDRTGLLLGADWAIGDTGYVGAAAGYGKSNFDVRDRRSDADADSSHVGVYGGVSNDRFGLQAGLGYTQHDLDTRRKVGFAGFNDQLNAGYDARTTQAFVRGEVALTPVVRGFAEAAHVQVKSDGFQERGGQAALRVEDGDTKASYATLGLKLDLPADDSGLHLRGSFGWRHRFGGDDEASSVNHFGTGAAFTVYAPQMKRGSFVGEVGLVWALGKTSQLSLDYAGSAGGGAGGAGGGAADSSVQARYAIQF